MLGQTGVFFLLIMGSITYYRSSYGIRILGAMLVNISSSINTNIMQ